MVSDDALDTLQAWLRIQRTPGFGISGAKRLIEAFGSLPNAFAASNAELAAAGFSEAARRALRTGRESPIEAALEWAAQPNHHLIAFGTSAYPRRLAELNDAPVLLYAAGDIDLLHHAQLAIVGSRHPTPAGRDNAYHFAKHLAHAGLGITSGLALGIDGAAHEGALDASGITVAVAATGLDRVYPASHRELAKRIVAEGVMLSETPLNTPVSRGAFPRRNRLISGLSMGVLVVEATLKSGSLVTARLASDQGRDVFAIPGSIHNPMARGCHRLIREGAKLVETADDILAELAVQGMLDAAPRSASAPAEEDDTLDAEQRTLLGAMGYEPTAVDTLVARTGLTPAAVSSMLLILELGGHVAAVDGGRYMRTP
ncbi:DNA-processing protein DprA [Acidihalobacter ferrooxydans]|uniref:DNA protecting protein DprA n=1 Tax=Acidihalobacter ferrooxydans TaxID=1765967 RepID=A0A1P8UKN0_9GAMM|nr:DNA-processing protein DprA [Acidihalobacter ferrooxydans]APZ44379.1 DNA protecting protein DprA [Acidihalobacter ferrooxydans]